MSAGLWVRDSAGVSRKIKKLYTNVGGVTREIKELWVNDAGVSQKIFSGAITWTFSIDITGDGVSTVDDAPSYYGDDFTFAIYQHQRSSGSHGFDFRCNLNLPDVSSIRISETYGKHSLNPSVNINGQSQGFGDYYSIDGPLQSVDISDHWSSSSDEQNVYYKVTVYLRDGTHFLLNNAWSHEI